MCLVWLRLISFVAGEARPLQLRRTQIVEADRIRYWKNFKELKDSLVHIPKVSIDSGKYVTFEDDTGGWNNIRMALEVFVVVAKVTDRILVLPPRVKFYLLDTGPISAFEKDKSKRGTSSYDDYFDFQVLQRTLQVITTEEFIAREATSLKIPLDVLAGVEKVVSNGHHTPYFLWLRDSVDSVIWPSGPAVKTDFTLALGSNVHPEKKILHFPMHVSKNLRYLSGVMPLIRGLALDYQRAVKHFVTSSLVYSKDIYRYAEAYIKCLNGTGSYFSIHIRRNELQYKNAFSPAQDSINNIRSLIHPSKMIYLATDENSEDYFQAFRQSGMKYVTMKDLRYQVNQMLGEAIHPKYEGMVEQLICASGRMFVGTRFSTYSAHIMRLRKIIFRGDAPCLYHTVRYGTLADVSTASCSTGNFVDEVNMGFY